MQDRISGCSSGREMLMRLWGDSGDGDCDCDCARLQAAAKKGDVQRVSLWAAKRRPSGPTAMVTIDVLDGFFSGELPLPVLWRLSSRRDGVLGESRMGFLARWDAVAVAFPARYRGDRLSVGLWDGRLMEGMFWLLCCWVNIFKTAE